MLPKRQKITPSKSASTDANSNHSIISMFARQRSQNQLQNVQTDNRCMIRQTAYSPEVTDRLRSDNRLSLSSRRKHCTTDTVVKASNYADSNNTVDISEPTCTVFHSDATVCRKNDSSETILSFENCPDAVSSVSTYQQGDSTVTSNQEEESVCDGNSVANLLPENHNTEETQTEVARVPYYLENFRLVLDSVFNDTFYAELFNDDDLSALRTFNSLSGNCDGV